MPGAAEVIVFVFNNKKFVKLEIDFYFAKINRTKNQYRGKESVQCPC